MHIDREKIEEWELENVAYRLFLENVQNQLTVGIAVWIAIGTLIMTWAVMSIR